MLAQLRNTVNMEAARLRLQEDQLYKDVCAFDWAAYLVRLCERGEVGACIYHHGPLYLKAVERKILELFTTEEMQDPDFQVKLSIPHQAVTVLWSSPSYVAEISQVSDSLGMGRYIPVSWYKLEDVLYATG